MGRKQAWWQLAAAAGAAILGLGLYDRNTDYPGMVSVQLGGSEQRWPPTDRADLETALLWDFVLVVGYGLALLLLIGLAPTPRSRSSTCRRCSAAARASTTRRRSRRCSRV